jgi:hypothetical protein
VTNQSKFDQPAGLPASDATAAAVPARASWREAGIVDHFVQFYRDDSVVIEAVAGFIAAGLGKVEGGIVIATNAHRHAIEERLEAQGADLPAARLRRQYVSLDAEETLAGFMVDGMPDETLFMQVVGRPVIQMLSAGFRVRLFGEIVALLWAAGNPEAAIQLEHLWNKLGQRWRFSLFCAHPAAHFAGEPNDAGFRCVCATHTGFIPAEGTGDEIRAGVSAR